MRFSSLALPEATALIFRRLHVLIILLLVAAALVSGNARAQSAPPAAAAPSTAAAPTASAGVVVHIPVTIDYLALAAAMKQQLYTDHGRAPLWNGDDRCQFFYAENPRFARAGGNVKLESDGSLMIGVMMGSQCVSPIVWNGIIEAETAPYIAPKLQLKFRVTDLNLYDQNHQKTLLVGKGFDLIKQYYIPRLETFTFDLSPAFEQFQELVKAGAPPEVVERVNQTLTTLRAEPQLTAQDNGVRAIIDLTVPPFEPIPTSSVPVQLTPQELAAFEKKLDQWDSFLVFAIKQMGTSANDPQLRDDLLALLIDSRHRLVDALAHPPPAGGPDPIRLLFLDEWQRLGEIIREAVRRGTLGSQSLQFLSFMSAGDALFALDQAAPALGVRISADDLRRLAKMIGPSTSADPLSFGFEEDPELRKMFHVREPLASEGPLDTESSIVETPKATAAESGAPTPAASGIALPMATGSGAATPATGILNTAAPPETPGPGKATVIGPATISPTSTEAPSFEPTAEPSREPTREPTGAPTPDIEPTEAITPAAEPSPEISPTPSPLSMLMKLLTPNDADAAEANAPKKVDFVVKLQDLAKKLKRKVVNSASADEYRENYDQLLQFGAQRVTNDENLDYRFRPLFLRLVKSAAWQESCWRQFVLDGNRVTYLESSTHDIGLMQVNKYVWRGFYNIDRLEWDVLYNASAGMEILARLLDSIEVKRGAFSPQNPDELARSIYAGYNGGPGSYKRWRGHEAKPLRAIDNSFWEKYQAVQHGHQIDILSCAEDWGSQH